MHESPPYPQVVLDHYRNPRHRGVLDGCTHAADGANPLCGDRLRIELRCDAGRIGEMRFSGEACAIAIATASMLGDCVAGLAREDVAALSARLQHLLATGETDTVPGALPALAGLHRHPARHKCAMLPLATLCAALDGRTQTTTVQTGVT